MGVMVPALSYIITHSRIFLSCWGFYWRMHSIDLKARGWECLREFFLNDMCRELQLLAPWMLKCSTTLFWFLFLAVVLFGVFLFLPFREVVSLNFFFLIIYWWKVWFLLEKESVAHFEVAREDSTIENKCCVTHDSLTD